MQWHFEYLNQNRDHFLWIKPFTQQSRGLPALLSKRCFKEISSYRTSFLENSIQFEIWVFLIVVSEKPFLITVCLSEAFCPDTEDKDRRSKCRVESLCIINLNLIMDKFGTLFESVTHHYCHNSSKTLWHHKRRALMGNEKKRRKIQKWRKKQLYAPRFAHISTNFIKLGSLM